VKFEWDENKRIANLKKHGFDFADAYIVFEDENAVRYPDEREDYGEERFVIVGKINGIIIASVCYAGRNENIRIISMRYASKERIYYGDSSVHN